MSHIDTEPGAPLVRASDAERDQAAEILRTAFAEGRLTPAELDERDLLARHRAPPAARVTSVMPGRRAGRARRSV